MDRLEKTLVEKICDKNLYSVRTHLPAQVVSYDSTLNTCSVQPCIKQLVFTNPDKTEINLPQLNDVPVAQIGSGKLLLSAAPQVGSYGVIHVFDRTIEEWLQDGGILAPGNTRKHDLSDVVFYPGLYHLTDDGDNGLIATGLDTDRISIRTRSGSTKISVLDDDSISIETSGDIVFQNGTDYAVQYTALKSAFDTLRTDLNTFIGIFNAHFHADVPALKSVPSTPVSPTAVVSSADMSGSQIDDIRFP